MNAEGYENVVVVKMFVPHSEFNSYKRIAFSKNSLLLLPTQKLIVIIYYYYYLHNVHSYYLLLLPTESSQL